MPQLKSCDLCPKTFVHSGSLSYHKKTHREAKEYDCLQCDESFKLESHLKTHSLTHTGEKSHKCVHCSFSCKNTSSLKRHVLKQHSEVKCKQCDFTCIGQVTLKTHAKTHTKPVIFKCNVCSKSFSQTSHLNKHKKSMHS